MPSIIVPARNNREFTQRCLGTILHSIGALKLKCEIVLIDDESEPDEKLVDLFRQFRSQAAGHEVKIIRSRKRQHYSGVFSIGLHHSTHDVIFFISNDMYVTPRFLQAELLVSALSRDFGIVRGTSNHTDSHAEHMVVPPEMPKAYPDVEAMSHKVFAQNACAYVEDRVLSGDAILIKREVVDKIGVLDLRFFGYFGDIDYGMRAHLAGFKLVCAKGAWLFHEGAGHVKGEMARADNAQFDEFRRRRLEMVDAAYQEFRKKWNIAAPEHYAELNSLYFFEQAEAQADRVSLKCDFPLSVLNDLEYY